MCIQQRLLELSKLQDGWYENEGYSFESQSLFRFGQLFEQFYNKNLPEPYIFPMVNENTISLEWKIGNWNIILEVDLLSYIGNFFASDIGDVDIEKSLDLKNENDWIILNNIIENFIL